MDPNANIEEQRAIVARLHVNEYSDRRDRLIDHECLAELVQALDGWLCSGGFLPRTWVRP